MAMVNAGGNADADAYCPTGSGGTAAAGPLQRSTKPHKMKYVHIHCCTALGEVGHAPTILHTYANSV